jgi:hypothetical protein
MFDPLRFQDLHDESVLEAQVEKDNFHQFNSDFHKEKEMVDFRKWLFALAVGLLLGVGSSAANAQSNAFSCTASAVPNIVRAEGITELMGDMILNCTGGTPTLNGQPIPLANVTITINTAVTSRIVDPTVNASEALLLIDEPFPSNPVPAGSVAPVGRATTQLGCLANNSTACVITSVGPGLGAVGSYNGTTGHPNIFQGVQTPGYTNQITWTGIPIDAPGTAGTRVIRITNIRGNAFQLTAGTSLIPTTISEVVAVNGSSTINSTTVSAVVASVAPGLLQPPTINGTAGAAAYSQCNSVNTYLLSPQPSNYVTTDSGILVSVEEGFAQSFKPQSYAQIAAAIADTDYEAPGDPSLQNIPGFSYNTESGFVPGLATPLPNLVTTISGEAIGLADHGTQIQFTVSGVGSGVNLYAPPYVFLSGNYGTGAPLGLAVLINQSESVGGAFSGGSSSIPVVLQGATLPTVAPIPIAVSGTSATLIYEIYYADASVQETLAVPISVEYTSNTGSNIPPTTTTAATVGVEFAPQSTVGTASSSAPIPRFGPSGSPVGIYTISPCSCNLLFPFVTNIAGFDTGIAIANTTADPFGTSAQTGTVTLNYYGATSGGGAAPPQAISSSITGGQEVIFTLSNGGNYGIPATPGFEGYIIAQANFQYCHGFAFISDVGAQKLAEGYLAIQLDKPTLNRTGNAGENEGH